MCLELAPPRCYQILSAAEFAGKAANLPAQERESITLSGALATVADVRGGIGYPAFQLETRLDVETFSILRRLYAQSGSSETLLWDFLRTRHSDLGGRTGVDFLLCYFNATVACLSYEDRLALFLGLAREDIWKSSQ